MAPSLKIANLGSTADINYASKSTITLEFTSVHSGVYVEFPAYLTDFSQNFASSWNQEDVFGRSDPIASFQNTKRTLSLGWDVPAGDSSRAKKNLQHYSRLVQMLYPGYITNRVYPAEAFTGGAHLPAGAREVVGGDGFVIDVDAYSQTMSKPPLIKIKFANLICNSADGSGLLGYVDGFSMKPALEMGYFIVDENGEKKLYPKVFSLSCGFTVLHQHDLGYGTGGGWMSSDNYPFK